MQSRQYTVSSLTAADRPYSVAHDPVCDGRGLGCLRHRHMKVELLDALSVSISVCRKDFGTAGMVMFLLEVGELLEEWTRKKSVADLARCMSLERRPCMGAYRTGRGAGTGLTDPARGRGSRAGRRGHSHGRPGIGRGSYRQSGIPHRGVHSGTQAPRRGSFMPEPLWKKAKAFLK